MTYKTMRCYLGLPRKRTPSAFFASMAWIGEEAIFPHNKKVGMVKILLHSGQEM